jgi:hypothetical protein
MADVPSFLFLARQCLTTLVTFTNVLWLSWWVEQNCGIFSENTGLPVSKPTYSPVTYIFWSSWHDWKPVLLLWHALPSSFSQRNYVVCNTYRHLSSIISYALLWNVHVCCINITPWYRGGGGGGEYRHHIGIPVPCTVWSKRLCALDDYSTKTRKKF